MMRFYFRAGLVIGLPFILVMAFVVTLCREVGRAFRYAWLDVRGEISSFRDLWNNARFS